MSSEMQLINPRTIGAELEKFIPQMERALPRHMTADRMARIALTSLRVNPKLMSCTRDSFYGSLMAASQLGLEPGINGQCYLIPYYDNRNKISICTLVPGWRGYMDLVNRTERASAWTEAVYDGDEFDYELGSSPSIRHKRGKWKGTEAALMYVYSVGRIKNSDFPVIDVWDIDKIWAHRDKQNKVGERHYSYVHPEMYARKIPLLQVIKYLPSSIEIASASALDASAAEGNQSLTIDMALKGELEQGGNIEIPSASDPLEGELDKLFEALKTNPAAQQMMRESYAGRTQELVTYLQGRLEPTVQAKDPQVKQSLESSSVATGEVKRGRGRPKKITKETPTQEEKSTTYFALEPEEQEEAEEEVTERYDQEETEQQEMGGSAFDLI